MASNYTFRGVADMRAHDSAIKKSASEVYKYQKRVEDSRKEMETFKTKVGNAMSGVAAAFGTAYAAVETFKSYMDASYSSQMKFQSTLDGCKTTVNNFFTALQTGDFSVFENGLLNAIRLAKEYQRQMKLAGMASTIGKTQAEGFEAQRNNYESIIKSGDATYSEKQSALAEYERLSNEEIKVRQQTIDFLYKSISTGLKAINVSGLTTAEEIRNAINNYLNPSAGGFSQLDKFELLRSETAAAQRTYQQTVAAGGDGSLIYDKWMGLAVQLKEYIDANPNIEEMSRFREFYGKEENFSELSAILDELNDNLDKIGTIKKDIDGAKEDAKKFNVPTNIEPKIINPDKPVKINVEFEEGSLADLENKLNQVNETIRKTNLDDKNLGILQGERNSLETQIEKLKERLGLFKQTTIELNEETNTLNGIQRALANAKQQIQLELIGTEEYYRLAQQIKDLTSKEHKVIVKVETDTKTEEEKAQEALQEMKEKAELTSNAISSIGSAFSALGNAVGGTGGKILEVLGATGQAISQLIPQVVSLIAAKEGEAIASGTASAAKLPFPANLAAIGSIVGTITALFATYIGAFKDGGIIGGSTTLGDFNIARVNKGEMILNGTQQSRLFNLLNNGGTLSNNEFSGGNVQFKINGKDLVGILNTQNKRTSKVI